MGDQLVEKVPPVPLPTWMSEKCVLVAWMASFGILIALSFSTFIPVAITMNDTDGNCFLYGDFSGYGASSICCYIIVFAVIFLIICVLRLILLVMKVIQFSTRVTDMIHIWFSIWGVHLLILCLDVVLLLLLVTSCLLSVGLSKLCHSHFRGRELCSSDFGIRLHNRELNTSFYTVLTVAEGSAWLTLVYWFVVTTLETFLLWKDGTFEKVFIHVGSFVR